MLRGDIVAADCASEEYRLDLRSLSLTKQRQVNVLAASHQNSICSPNNKYWRLSIMKYSVQPTARSQDSLPSPSASSSILIYVPMPGREHTEGFSMSIFRPDSDPNNRLGTADYFDECTSKRKDTEQEHRWGEFGKRSHGSRPRQSPWLLPEPKAVRKEVVSRSQVHDRFKDGRIFGYDKVIKKARLARGWSVNKLARRLQVSHYFANNIQKSNGGVRLEHISVLNRALKLELPLPFFAMDKLAAKGRTGARVSLRASDY
jgi:ribosome-binding protein aMBF1 (putative translation factor)